MNGLNIEAADRRRLPARWLLVSISALADAAGARAEADKSVEHDLGAKEKSYRVLIPLDVKKGRKLPVVVYLHPSGNANFDQARRDYWPMLREMKCLMLMPRSRGKTMWLADEGQFVLDCIEHVQGLYSVDPKRVILMGVSGGGQTALFVADKVPEIFRAVIPISTSPVVARGRRAEWFYPNRAVLKTCPYFVINHITQGSSLMYWRQVRGKLEPRGASITIRPVVGPAGHYVGPPKELSAWMKQVLAGEHPKPPADPQKLAVARQFARVAAALPAALGSAKPAAPAKRIEKSGPTYDLSVPLPADWQRSEKEDRADSTGAPMTQIRMEHKTWPIYLRVEACATAKTMTRVLAAEEAETKTRGMLYQVYHTLKVAAGGRTWAVKIGSITFPDRRKDAAGKVRGWVSTLFVHASAPIREDPKRWLTVMIMDETHQPDAAQLAAVFRAAAGGLTVKKAAPKPPSPTTKPK